jgi:hypothetical protein
MTSPIVSGLVSSRRGTVPAGVPTRRSRIRLRRETMGRASSARSTLCARRERDDFAGSHRRTACIARRRRNHEGGGLHLLPRLKTFTRRFAGVQNRIHEQRCSVPFLATEAVEKSGAALSPR